MAALTPMSAAGANPAFANGVAQGTVTTFYLWEASGLIASRQNPGVVWTHNDSGYAGSVFALSTNGTLLAQYSVPNVWGGDFEDIAFGPGPSPETHYIYLGDIGDNYSTRPSIQVFRFPEPAVYGYQSNNPPSRLVAGATGITLRYPDGPYNAEALLIDPLNGDLFIATKLTNSSRIYRATRAELDSGDVTLTFIREISFFKVSAGDVSADGSLVALRRGGTGALWVRAAGQSIGDVLAGNSINIPIANEPNGEALGFHPTGLGYYTLSEGSSQPLFYYRRTDSGVPRQPVVMIHPGESWRFDDSGLDLGTAWRATNYNDAAWASGPAQLGNGEGDEQTLIPAGSDPFRNPTIYFRKRFAVTNAAALSNLALRICFNDGAAAYLNGVEILRHNLPADAAFDTTATASNTDLQNYWHSVPLSPALLRSGTNTLAVELHRFDGNGPGLSFDLQLGEGKVDLPAHFTGLPKLVGGFWRIPIAGPVGSVAQIESTGNWVDWLPAGQVVLTNGTGLFQDPAIPGNVNRFYRLQR